ncbi:MAG: hypothetical protein LBS07_05845, partial [Prevotellaceae bacterium]|jgi:hypothetical protein|nr:hypothetical protein [Prevotellaceae bacterium]
LAAVFSGCHKTVYVPVESVKTEYRDNYLRDSVYLHDSIFVKEKGDTVFVNAFRYLYRDRTVRDSIAVHDTVKVPYPVEVEKPVKYVSGWQNFQIWCGRIALGGISVFVAYKYLRRKWPWMLKK